MVPELSVGIDLYGELPFSKRALTYLCARNEHAFKLLAAREIEPAGDGPNQELLFPLNKW